MRSSTEPRRRYADLSYGQLHYVDAGRGEPLLLLHSAPRSSRAYRFLQPRLAERYRVIAPDLPGFGASDALPGSPTMEAFGTAMVALLDALELPRAHVFGYHTGNKVAAALAAEHGSHVDRLVLCGQIHSIIPDKQARDDAIRAIVAKYFIDYPASRAGDEHLRRWLADFRDVTDFALPRSIFEKTPITAADIDELKIRVLDHLQALGAVRATYAANFDFDLAAALQRIHAKTLFIELVMPDEVHYGRQLEALCALVPGSRGTTLEGAGRVAVESHAAQLARILFDFLAEPA